MTQKEQVKLEIMMDQLLEMKEDISELKDRILDPDTGLIVQTNRNTWYRKENDYLIKEIPELIQFKKTAYRVLWIIISAVVALGVGVVSMHP